MMKLNLLGILSLLFLLACNQSVSKVTDTNATEASTTSIVAGTAKITGSITSLNDTSKDSIFVHVYVPHPISGEVVPYKALVDQSGKFSVDVDVETAVSLVGLNTSLNPYKTLYVELTSGNVTNLDIAYTSDFDIENVDVTPANMTQHDMIRGLEVMYNMLSYRSGKAPEQLYNKSTDYFQNLFKAGLSERLKILNNDSLLSNELKEVLSKDLRLTRYTTHVFNYEAEMMMNYRNTGDNKSNKPDIQKIDRTYYRFLKDFKLNDPQYLLASSFFEFQKEILQNEILGLPEIGESDIPSWLASVKVTLSDLVESAVAHTTMF